MGLKTNRSANRSNSYNVWNVNVTGGLNNNNANNSNAAVPDLGLYPLIRLSHRDNAEGIKIEGSFQPCLKANKYEDVGVLYQTR